MLLHLKRDITTFKNISDVREIFKDILELFAFDPFYFLLFFLYVIHPYSGDRQDIY